MKDENNEQDTTNHTSGKRPWNAVQAGRGHEIKIKHSLTLTIIFVFAI